MRSTFIDLEPSCRPMTDRNGRGCPPRPGGAGDKGYIIDVVEATRRHPEVLLGASPRSALYLQRAARAWAASEGREYVIPDDVKHLAHPVLEHRLSFRPEAQMRGVTAKEVVGALLDGLKVPVARSGR